MEDEYNKNMEELTEKEKKIADIINARRDQAIEKKIFDKIYKIVDILGNTTENTINSYSSTYQDTTFNLNVESDYYQVDLDINPIGHNFVFRGRSDDPRRIDLYIPEDAWEEHLTFLYKKALAKEKIQELQHIENQQDRQIKTWRITEEELF